ncbi:hypothetical protein [Motiliproteus sp. MSK22-1]|uniref:hypothetical protein n=1 Tax=Motiliproteus sp. MSK22-1 TaxID=1897630 RepID=UPI0009782927|nr:hypothetical protein [Motiliproteus sp. MSK22-1]OMH29358.1 hypothetical protein BGP75_19960 [Motiliproteus sp. MSK22-1]
MHIYSVLRYGNDEEGPDGYDTEFIVLASSVKDAAEVADKELLKYPNKLVASFCEAVTLVGDSYSEATKSILLSGPVINSNTRFDFSIPMNLMWRRDTQDGEWIVLDEYLG